LPEILLRILVMHFALLKTVGNAIVFLLIRTVLNSINCKLKYNSILMRKIFFSSAIIFLISSCASVNQFVVTPVGDEPAEYLGRFVYSLPQTVLEVSIDFEKTTFLPGPYRRFSERFLGMSEFIETETSKWEIKDVRVSSFTEPDPLHYYSVNILKGSFQADNYFKMISEGLAIDPMGMLFSSSSLPLNMSDNTPQIVDFSMKKNQVEISDTLFKTVIRDSSFVKIPILRKQKDAKTLEQKAEEAAHLIIKIRKRRMKLMTGEYEVFPDGKALEISVEELNKLEKEYLALFIGKIHSETYSRSFFVVPAGGSEKTTLARFSGEKGILPVGSSEGKPVELVFKPIHVFPFDIGGADEIKENTLYYRIPATCALQISDPENLLYDGRLSLFQAGNILPLPIKEK